MKINQLIHKVIGRRQDGKNLRNVRNERFKEFALSAEKTFKEFAANTPGQIALENNHGLIVAKGGAMGGFDERIVEIKYGATPYEQITEFADPDNMFAGTKKRLLVSDGARLFYERTDTGSVYCLLYPSKTENLRPIESVIILDVINDAANLNKKRLPKKHWKYFTSYMHVTSLDGSPTYLDEAKVFWLRISRILIVDGKSQPRKSIKWLLSILSVALSVGLSGSLLFGIQYYFSLTVPATQIDNKSLQPSPIPRPSHWPETTIVSNHMVTNNS